jgi:hypothetical protein
MSNELLIETAETEQSGVLEYQVGPIRPINADASGQSAKVQQVWCAPMSEAGEWVITWTRLPGAVTYELQTSLEPGQWGCILKFSGTRAVLLLGPVPRCCVRVRAIGIDGPGEWSTPTAAEKGDRCSVAA